MTAEQRVQILLRTLDDARIAWEANAAGGGALLMPSAYHEGSYRELERCMIEMRENGHSARVVACPASLPSRRTTHDHGPGSSASGPRPVLPKRVELVAGGTVSGDRTARVRVYVWDERVDQQLADEGVRLLVRIMYDGDRQRITVPKAIWDAAVGCLD